MRLILGSQSPRRKEILGYFSIPFEQATPNFVEENIPFEGNPHEYVNILSRGKAESLVHRFPKAVIITADTIVYRNGKIYGKPATHAEAMQTFEELSGEWHSVFTGITVAYENHYYQDVEESKVLFNKLTPKQMENYFRDVHCLDKAGGYAIQESGAIIARKIDGCFYNVMGLPINNLRNLLLKVGIDLWDHLKA